MSVKCEAVSRRDRTGTALAKLRTYARSFPPHSLGMHVCMYMLGDSSFIEYRFYDRSAKVVGIFLLYQ